MVDRPMIFSGPMVKALLEGRKSMTRRVLKPVRGLTVGELQDEGEKDGDIVRCARHQVRDPVHRVGDLLWVREALSFWPGHAEYAADGERVVAATGAAQTWVESYARAKAPSLHMPRWASRLTLQVTDVHVQRLQEISAADALAEGVYRSDPTPDDEEWNRTWCEENGHPLEPLAPVWMAPGTRRGWGRDKAERDREEWGPTPQFAFRCVWNGIHGAGAWDVNPWCCAISFRCIPKNIDDVLRREAA
jgi:hypothetical protein